MKFLHVLLLTWSDGNQTVQIYRQPTDEHTPELLDQLRQQHGDELDAVFRFAVLRLAVVPERVTHCGMVGEAPLIHPINPNDGTDNGNNNNNNNDNGNGNGNGNGNSTDEPKGGDWLV